MSKETNTRHFNVASLQPLGVGWLQLLLILSTGSIYTKKEEKKKNRKIQYLTTTHILCWKRIILPSAYCRGYRIADCHVFSFKKYISLYAYFLHRKHNLLHLGFHLEWTQSKQSRSDDIKNKTKSWEHCVLTEAPHCFRPYMRFHRSVVVPVPSQSTTQQWHCQHW